MADVRFHRTDGAKLLFLCVTFPSLFQPGNFDWVANLGRRPVGFDQPDLICGNLCVVECRLDDFALALNTGRRVASLTSPVVIDAHAFDHGMDRVTGVDCVLQGSQQNRATGLREYSSRSAVIKRSAVSVGRVNQAGAMLIAFAHWP